MPRCTPLIRIAALALLATSCQAFAQSDADYQALKKEMEQYKAETQQEIQSLQAEVKHLRDQNADSANDGPLVPADQSKITLDPGVTNLTLFGDIRFRYQYDQYQQTQSNYNYGYGPTTYKVVPGPVPGWITLRSPPGQRYTKLQAYQSTAQQDGELFLLRIGSDIQLGDQFFAGVTLATGKAADNNNQTFTEGYDNYNIYIDKVFAGWTPTDWFTVTLGKQANPIYTTDLVWDADINPAGVSEGLDLSKAFPAIDPRLSLKLIALQGDYYYNSANNSGDINNTSAWQFVEQVMGTWHFDRDISITLAPGITTYNDASASGLDNERAFNNPTVFPIGDFYHSITGDLTLITAPAMFPSSSAAFLPSSIGISPTTPRAASAPPSSTPPPMPPLTTSHVSPASSLAKTCTPATGLSSRISAAWAWIPSTPTSTTTTSPSVPSMFRASLSASPTTSPILSLAPSTTPTHGGSAPRPWSVIPTAPWILPMPTLWTFSRST